MNFKYIANRKDPVMILPEDLIILIFSTFSDNELKTCKAVSKSWYFYSEKTCLRNETILINCQNIGIKYTQRHLSLLPSHSIFEEHLKQVFIWLKTSNIYQIDLSNSLFADDEWLNLIKINCPNIKAINLSACPEISITGVLNLVDNTKITFLNLSWCRKISTETLEQNKPEFFDLIPTPWNRTLQRCEGQQIIQHPCETFSSKSAMNSGPELSTKLIIHR